MILADQRAEICHRVQRVTEPNATGARGKPCAHFIKDRALDQRARSGDAGLASGAENPCKNPGFGLVETLGVSPWVLVAGFWAICLPLFAWFEKKGL